MLFWALQNLDWGDETIASLWDLWRFFMSTIRDGRIVWVLLIVVGVLIFFRRKKR